MAEGARRFAGRAWPIVGVFAAGNTGFASEVWGDVDQIAQAFRRPVYSSVVLRLRDPAALCALKAPLRAGLVVAVVGIGPQPLTLPAPAALALAGGVRAVLLLGVLRARVEQPPAGQAPSRLHRPTLRASLEVRSVGRDPRGWRRIPLRRDGSAPRALAVAISRAVGQLP